MSLWPSSSSSHCLPLTRRPLIHASLLFRGPSFVGHSPQLRCTRSLTYAELFRRYGAITTGKVHDVRMLDKITIAEDAIYTMDRAYVDFARLDALYQQDAFVVRVKNTHRYRRLYSLPKDKDAGIRADQIVALTTQKSKRGYPELLRRVSCVDKKKTRNWCFLPTTLKFRHR